MNENDLKPGDICRLLSLPEGSKNQLGYKYYTVGSLVVVVDYALSTYKVKSIPNNVHADDFTYVFRSRLELITRGGALSEALNI